MRDDPEIVRLVEDEQKYAQALANLEKKPDEQLQTNLETRLRRLQDDLDTIIQRAKQHIFERIRQRLQQGIGNQLSNKILEQMLPEGAFQAQLQAQKVSLLKTYGELVEKRNRLKEQLENLYKQVFSDAAFTEQDLLRTGQEERRMFFDINQLEKQITPFLQTLDDYEKARQLLRQANELQQRLNQVGAESVAAYQKDLDNWSLRITSELSSQKLQALKFYARWQDQFDSIKTSIDTHLQAERDRFQRVQRDYQTFLAQASTNKPWVEVVFNPSDPQDSYKQLWNQVYELLSSTVRCVQDDLRAAYERVVRLRGGSLENLPTTNRDTMHHNLEAMQRHLSTTIEQTATWVDALSKERLFEKIGVGREPKSAEEALGAVLRQVQGVDEWLAEMEGNVYGYEQQIAAARPSPQEETILAILKKLQQSAGMTEGVELGLLLQQPEMQSINWQDLLRLYSKQRLSIKITPVTFR